MTVKQLGEQMDKNFKQMDNKLEKMIKDNEEMKSKNIQIQEDINEIRNKIIENLLETNKMLQKKVENLEIKIENLEKKKTIEFESMNQYVRRNNMEIAGIPNIVSDKDLEEKVVNILDKINIKVDESDIEACHRLPATKRNPVKRTIVRFVNRKNSEICLKSKKKLSEISMTDLEFPESTELFISKNLKTFG